MSNQRFTDKVAVVTGGASGIGLATTRRLVAEGARVVVADLAAGALADVEAELGDAVATVEGDISDEAHVAGLVTTATERFGRLDIAFANAGIGSIARLADLSVEEWNRVLAINLTGPYLLIKHAGPAMGAGGSIVVTASLNAVQPGVGMGAYCTSKAGAAMLVEVAAMELGPQRHPGQRRRPRPGHDTAHPGRHDAPRDPGRLRRQHARRPLRRARRRSPGWWRSSAPTRPATSPGPCS